MIPLFYNAAKLNMGFPGARRLCAVGPRQDPRVSNDWKKRGGKEHVRQLMLGRVKQYAPKGNAKATVCDFKNEYAYLAGCPGHFDHTHCMEGLRTFSEENERRIREGVTEADPFHVLLFSEWGMFCSVSDRRTVRKLLHSPQGSL